MGAPQTPKQIEEDDCVPRVAVVEEIRQQPERKLERRRATSGPRRRGLENELEGERRRPRRKPRKRYFLCLLLEPAHAFWDFGTTTPYPHHEQDEERSSFFRWQRTEFQKTRFWTPGFDWDDIENRRRLCHVAGISIDFLPIGTAALMNRRILITSANHLEPHMNRQTDLRIWTLGRAGMHNTPYRFRVWRVWRVLPRSLNPEHQHGARGRHCPRHDVAVIITLDQLYIYYKYPVRYQYAYRWKLVGPHDTLGEELFGAGSGYEYLEHVYENYKIFYMLHNRTNIVDCSKYLPKWWGKFICIKNIQRFPGVQNGSPLVDKDKLVGIGCFEIRYNEDRIYVYTDLRYYVRLIYKYADMKPGDYYEYAYPHWSVNLGWLYDGHGNDPYIPVWQIRKDLFPLGKK